MAEQPVLEQDNEGNLIGRIHPDFKKGFYLEILFAEIVLTGMLMLYASEFVLQLVLVIFPVQDIVLSMITGYFMSLLVMYIVSLPFAGSFFKSYYYKITAEYIEVHVGVLKRTTVQIPYERVQNLNVRLKIFQRPFKIYNIEIETAGIAGKLRKQGRFQGKSEGILLGIKNPDAMKRLITERIEKARILHGDVDGLGSSEYDVAGMIPGTVIVEEFRNLGQKIDVLLDRMDRFINS